jgi:hypothetical protein
MNTNIYKCVNESDLDEILNDNEHTLVTIMYVTKQTDPQNKLKRCIVDLAAEYVKCMFIYIDIESYIGTTHMITKTITSLPTTFIYLNNNNLATIEGNCVMTIKKTHIDVIQMVSKKINLSNDTELSHVKPQNNDEKTSVKINNKIAHEIDVKIEQPVNEENVIDEQQLLIDERRNNENTFKIKKIKSIQQMLNIKQLERLKKLKEMEERDYN